MANYPYTRDVPDGNNNPSVDRPDLTQNTNSIDSLIAEDHYSFGVNNGGFHKQVRMPVLGSIPSGLIGSSGTNYVKIVNNVIGGNQAQLFYTNGSSGNEYQLTRADNTNFSTFGLFTAYAGPPAGTAGWTFLPGNIRFQYGISTIASGSGNIPITFPIAYSQLFVVVCTFRSSAGLISYQIASQSNTGFVFRKDSTSNPHELNWMAIGI